jgi:Domain of unknown function (DUF222)
MSGTVVQEALAALRAAHDALARADVDSLDRHEILAALDELETLSCQLPTQGHRLLSRLQAETTPKALGAKSWRDVLAIRWRLSPGTASRRLADAEALGPRRALTGERLAPVLPAVAAAQALGLLTAEHVRELRDAMGRLPGGLDVTERERFEVDLVRLAVGIGPRELKEAAERRLFVLDQDGPIPDDAERHRRRGLVRGRQRPDGNVPVSGDLTPEAWATWEAIFAKFAAQGMCNPDDPEPCTSGTPSQAQIDADHRTLAQRRHDALLAIGRMALMSGTLGQLNGLPVTVIIRTTLHDLESRAGVGHTGGGTLVPISEVIRMAGHAHHYLAVFDGASGAALDLFRGRRTASPAQRIVLAAKYGGCTKPCCTVGVYGCQVHHATLDWSLGGNTNVNDLTLACGADNRMVHDRGYATVINRYGDTEWIPPADLDRGQARVNHYHRPDALLQDDGAGDDP